MMNDCPDGEMRDLLPGYVHGTLPAAQRAVVAAHLSSCEDCSAEVELIGAAARSFAAPVIDTGTILKALPATPRGSMSRSVRRPFAGSVRRVAAAIGIVAIGAFSVITLRGRFTAAADRAAPRSLAPKAGPGPTLVASAPARSAAPVPRESPTHPRASRAAPMATRAVISFGGGLSDLTDDQLDTLLGELDGIDALPSAEPETHLTPILPPGDGGHGVR
jgi:hypothetical protein